MKKLISDIGKKKIKEQKKSMYLKDSKIYFFLFKTNKKVQ